MIIFGTDELRLLYDLAIKAYGPALRRAIEDRFASPEKFRIAYHGPEGLPEPQEEDPLVPMTKKVWGKFLHRKITDQEVSIIIGSFTLLADLARQINGGHNEKQ